MAKIQAENDQVLHISSLFFLLLFLPIGGVASLSRPQTEKKFLKKKSIDAADGSNRV
jgi:hypothetical protein